VAKTKTRKTSAGEKEVTIDRRRLAKDRRKETAEKPKTEERRKPERRKVPRRRQIDPTTCERDYSNDEIEFMHAMDEYKRANGRMFPTCSEVLEVIRGLGYRRLTPAQLAMIELEPGTIADGTDGAISLAVTSLSVDGYDNDAEFGDE